MDKSRLAIRLKELRTQKGMSQEFLADESGLSLRTIQRIEKAESNPTGESLKRLANALHVNPDDLIDWSIKENTSYLNYLNLSALTFLAFPIFGVIIPFVIWTSKKGKIKHINQLGKGLINFQITWTLALFLIPILVYVASGTGFVASMSLSTFIIYILVLYAFNLVMVLFNSIRINNNQRAIYKPQIPFLK